MKIFPPNHAILIDTVVLFDLNTNPSATVHLVLPLVVLLDKSTTSVSSLLGQELEG